MHLLAAEAIVTQSMAWTDHDQLNDGVSTAGGSRDVMRFVRYLQSATATISSTQDYAT